MNSIPITYFLVWLLASSSAYSASEEFEKYKPIESPFSELIRAHDYETIKAIQTFGFKARHFQSTTGTRISDSRILFTGASSSEFSLTIDPDFVQIDNKIFENEGSLALFGTIQAILSDFTEVGDSIDIRSDYWRGEGYINISEILLSFANNVIFIGENSGGIDSQENQYILDVVPLSTTALPEIEVVQ